MHISLVWIKHTPSCAHEHAHLLLLKMRRIVKNPPHPKNKTIHQVTTCAESCEVIKAVTNGCKNTIWLLFLPPWWEQNWCRTIGLQTKKVSKQIPFPNGTQIGENAIRKNQVWENGTEWFRRLKGQPTKKIKFINSKNRGAKIKSIKWHDQLLYWNAFLPV